MRARLLAVGAVLLALVILALAQLVLTTPRAARAGGETFTVNSDLDASDASPNCTCLTSGGKCTLRAAIEEANACSGAQKILFSAAWHITPTTALPPITGDQTVVDGSDHWTTAGAYEVPGVVLTGEGGGFNGLVLSGTHQSAIYGLEIIRFGANGVYLCDGSTENKIGNTGSHQRNVISRNGANGVRIEGIASQRNVVKGNYVGTSPAGVAGWWDGVLDWGNGEHGVSVWDGADNEIRENLIADNVWSGATMDNVTSGQIVLNHIGMDVNGDPLGNGFYGVHLGNGAHAELYGNQIAFNSRGVYVVGASHATLLIDTIYSNTATIRTPPHGGGIFLTGSGAHATVRFAHVLSNTADFGGGIAVEDGATLDLTDSTIRGNRAQGAPGDAVGGGGIYAYQASVDVEYNEITGNSAIEPGHIAGARGGGACLDDVDWASVLGNEVLDNVVDGNSGGGGGIYVWYGADVTLARNVMVGNDSAIPSADASALHINNDPATSHTAIDANWIAYNPGSADAAVYIYTSAHVTVTNNVIVRNSHAGLKVAATDPDPTLRPVVNNTIAFNEGDGLIVEYASLQLYNTILAFNEGFGFNCHYACGYMRNGNDVWGNISGPDNVFMSWPLQQDPLFVDSSADLYSLLAGSPCIDEGNALLAPPTSYNGMPRPQGAGPDIGAYEMGFTYLPLVMRNY
jgi:hypothetical protein